MQRVAAPAEGNGEVLFAFGHVEPRMGRGDVIGNVLRREVARQVDVEMGDRYIADRKLLGV